MLQFAMIFSNAKIVVTLSRQLSWSHFTALLPLKKQEARMYYAQATAEEGWGVRELRESIERKNLSAAALLKYSKKHYCNPRNNPFLKILTFLIF